MRHDEAKNRVMLLYRTDLWSRLRATTPAETLKAGVRQAAAVFPELVREAQSKGWVGDVEDALATMT